MHYAKIHFGDYTKDTSHLTLLEHGVYFQMMRLYYTNEKPLPLDPTRIARFIGVRTEQELFAVQDILNEYFIKESDGWHQKRIDEEIAKYVERREINGEVGKLGGRPKKPTDNPNGFQTEPTDNPQITLTTNHKPLTNTKPKSNAKPSGFALPEWVPADAWDAFLETRVKIRAPMTDRAKTLAISELRKLRDQGHDPRAVLEQSVLRGWRGLFAPKTEAANEPTDWRKDPRFAGML